jgi:hypothetical protein
MVPHMDRPGYKPLPIPQPVITHSNQSVAA